jgi:hypothetical protein
MRLSLPVMAGAVAVGSISWLIGRFF